MIEVKGINQDGIAKGIYEMGLHETVFLRPHQLPENTVIMRVAGGWIYVINGAEPVFVPYDNEFQNPPAAEELSDVAQTCDGCGEQTHNDLLTMDDETQLQYCQSCISGGRFE